MVTLVAMTRSGAVSRRLTVAATAVVVGAALVVVQGPALAVAPGCPSDHPTAIGGSIYGYPDNYSLNAMIGFDMKAGSRTVNKDGVPPTTPGYGYIDTVNPTLPTTGSGDLGLDRHWGRGDGTASLCVSGTIDSIYLEVYPRSPTGLGGVLQTDKSRYGGSAHYRQPITPGANNQIALRLPLSDDLGGNTGLVNGYLTYNGGPIPAADITRTRAFTLGGGPDCGVEGFSAGADELGLSTSGTRTWYKIDRLAGGRCGAAAQRYSIQIDCGNGFCGAPLVTMSREIDVADGAGVALSYDFAG